MARPGYQRDTFYQPSRVPSGQGAALGTLAEELQRFGEFSRGIYEEQAIPKAQLAGEEAAARGDTKMRSGHNRVNQAYNEALVRAYALDAYADIHATLSQYEVEAGTDVGKFKSMVAGYRTGKIPAMLPAAQPIISQALQQRELDGVQRIGTLMAAEGHLNAVSQSERGLKTMEDQISRLYTAGDQNSIARADALTETYLSGLDANVAGGLYTERQAAAKRTEMYKNVTRNVAIGRMEAELAKPGGNPVGVIEEVMSKASPMLSDEERVGLTADLLQRLNIHQTIAAEKVLQEQGATQVLWAAGEKRATQLLLRGQLTATTLDRMVTNDELDPSIARSLRTALKEGGGTSDDKEQFMVETNLYDYSEEEIRDNPRLSWADKTALINKKRELEGGWQDSNPAQEARSRIDKELGIVPGSIMAALPDAVKTARGRALSAWYDRVDALPPEKRIPEAIKVAEEVIDEIIRSNINLKVEQLRSRRDAFVAGAGNPAKMSKGEKLKYDEKLKAYNDAISREEGKAK